MANGFILTICIPTITGREEQFNKLYNYLTAQLFEFGIWNEVQILYECDDRTMSIGNKRQLLLERSHGDYVVFIDDDDWISPTYAIQLWKACKEGNDCVGFLQQCTFNGRDPKIASLSNRWDAWGENIGGFAYVRTPFFPTPIKRDIAIQIGYEDLRWAEDYTFAVKVKPLIKTETFINDVLYFYQYEHQPHHKKYGKP